MSLRPPNNRDSPPLSEAAWEMLLARLNPESAPDGSGYLQLHENLIRYCALQGDEAPAEAADAVLDRVAQHLSQGRAISQVGPYAAGVARFVCRERRRHAGQAQVAAKSLVTNRESVGPKPPDEKVAAMRQCLATLSGAEQSLLHNYFADMPDVLPETQRAALAVASNLSVNALRVQVHRLRMRLENCLRKKFSFL